MPCTHTVHFLPAQRGSFQGSSLLPPPVVGRGGTAGCASCSRGSVGGSGIATAATAGRLAIAAGAAAMRRPCIGTNKNDGECGRFAQNFGGLADCRHSLRGPWHRAFAMHARNLNASAAANPVLLAQGTGAKSAQRTRCAPGRWRGESAGLAAAIMVTKSSGPGVQHRLQERSPALQRQLSVTMMRLYYSSQVGHSLSWWPMPSVRACIQ